MLYYSHDGGVQNPDKLINSLEQNMRLLRDSTFEGLKRGETLEGIENGIGGILPDLPWRMRGVRGILKETILGFATYFRRKGLL